MYVCNFLPHLSKEKMTMSYKVQHIMTQRLLRDSAEGPHYRKKDVCVNNLGLPVFFMIIIFHTCTTNK